MDIDYDTEQSIFAAADSSSSELMSAPDQRRLIKKPLPNLPPSQGDVTGGQSLILGRAGSPRQHIVSLEKSRQRAKKVSLQNQKHLDWWPAFPRSKKHSELAGKDESRPYSLNSVHKQHLIRIINSSLKASGRPSVELASIISNALLECLATISTPEAFKALRQSYSFLWRVEAMLRSSEELDCSKSSRREGESGRWIRLPGWGNSISSNSQSTTTDARRKKRDIALQLLGSALRINGRAALVETEVEVANLPESSEAEAVVEKVIVSRKSGSAPQLLVKSSVPTVALQKDNGTEGASFKAVEEESMKSASVLTSRLAMQLHNSSRAASDTPEKSTQKDEEATITVCRVCLDFTEEQLGEDNNEDDHRRRRSGTVTPETSRREENSSDMSILSDQTVQEHRWCDNVKIEWKENTFTGSPLLLNPLSSELEGHNHLSSKGESPLALVGGTFKIQLVDWDREEKTFIKELFNLGLYTVCAMMMESSLLRDFDLEEEEKEIKEDKETEEKCTPIENDPVEVPSDVESSDKAEVPSERQSRWSTNIWNILHYSSLDQSSPGRKVQAKRGRRPLGYFSRMMGSLSSSSASKQTFTTTAHEDGDYYEGQDSSKADSDQVQEVEVQIDEPAPNTISPYPRELAEDENIDKLDHSDYTSQLLSHQSICLNVLEGIDLSLSIGKQDQSFPIQRAPLVTRQSFPDSEVSSSNESSISISMPTHGIRSASQGGDTGPKILSKTQKSSLSTQSENRHQNYKDLLFYQKVGGSRDVSLGQAIEEMASKANLLDKQATQATKKTKESKDTMDIVSSSPRSYRLAQYLHRQDSISVMAQLIETEQGPGLESRPTSEVTAETQVSDAVPSSIIEALVSDTTSEQSNHQDIAMSTANIKTFGETSIKIMSEATYLSSFGAYLQAILSHPKLGHERHEVVRMLQIGNVVLKIQVQPIVIFDLLVEGPVVCSSTRVDDDEDKTKTTEKDHRDEKLLEKTRVEIQSFYSSVKRHTTALEHILVGRELSDKGETMNPSTVSSISTLQTQKDSNIGPIKENASGSALELLSKLKKSFRDAKVGLYDELKMTSARSINDIRWRLDIRSKSTRKRLSAWKEKHLDKKEMQQLEPLDYLQPEYFQDKVHVFPRSRFLFRESEPLSIIAYTLSTEEFDSEVHHKEQKLNDVLDWRTGVEAPSINLSASINSNRSTKVSSTSINNLDPDQDVEFDTSEPVQIRTKRKKRVKDAIILSLSLKRGNSDYSSHSDQVSSSSNSKDIATTAQDESDITTPTSSQITVSSGYDTVTSGDDTFRAHITHLNAKPSLGSMFENDSIAPPTPLQERNSDLPSNRSAISHLTAREISNTSSLTIPSQEQRRSVSQPVNSIHNDVKSTPTSPHIKHTIVSGNLKVSCISWFAEEFASLRKRWNIESEFVESLSRCKTWSALGGKSKSGFYVTLDGKWIAKQLINVWSIDEKEAFLDFAPTYLRYMANNASNDDSTLLVKIAGVYTLKIKDIKSGEVKLKISVQVIENVFAGDGGGSIRFDVKGIKDRRVQLKKEKDLQQQEEAERAPVWWDAEWLDTFQKRAFVPQHQMEIFQRALNNDLAFLTKANVMDYSLLIGANEGTFDENDEKEGSDRPSFTVRIVDFLGAFTIAKAIESSGKRAIKNQVPTVIPPTEYAARFGSSLMTYFTASPM